MSRAGNTGPAPWVYVMYPPLRLVATGTGASRRLRPASLRRWRLVVLRHVDDGLMVEVVGVGDQRIGVPIRDGNLACHAEVVGVTLHFRRRHVTVLAVTRADVGQVSLEDLQRRVQRRVER